MAVHVQCNTCGAWGITENHAAPDAVVRCASPEDEPAGSAEGSCCTDGATHEEHVAHAAATGDSNCRPVTITIMGSEHGAPGGGVSLLGAS